jgi:hypothetical protein
MTYVEHNRRFPGSQWRQWAQPFPRKSGLKVEYAGAALQVAGCLRISHDEQEAPSDFLSQYRIARKDRSIGKQNTGKDSPHIRFANADTDEKLVAFVRSFGPVVAESVKMTGEDRSIAVTAIQDLNELRRERLIYRAALGLAMLLGNSRFDYVEAQSLIQEIATDVADWPRQWERQRREQKTEPVWRLTAHSLKRIEGLSSGRQDVLLPPNIDARIVLCELVNAFPQVAFPNVLEMNSSIRYGIRPLLYETLRRESLHQHDTAICANTQCRDFFEIERAGQQFCSPECSLHQRQRDYWNKRGKKRRAERFKGLRKQALGK